jgi:hypothetical protein
MPNIHIRPALLAPPELPFPATEENKDKLRKFFEDYYRSSTFNTCQHQPLPMLHGIHVKENARPHAIYTLATVLIHWKAKLRLTG